MKATAIILAGGKSSRFGSDKTVLSFDGEKMVERIVRECRVFCDEIFIVSNAVNKFALPGVTELFDQYPNTGPLGGIHSGLSAANHEVAFVTACDMPFFDAKLGQILLHQIGNHDAVVPCIGEQIEPLYAVYRKTVQQQIEKQMKVGCFSVRALYPLIDVTYYNCETICYGDENINHTPFYNINYPKDFNKLAALVK